MAENIWQDLASQFSYPPPESSRVQRKRIHGKIILTITPEARNQLQGDSKFSNLQRIGPKLSESERIRSKISTLLFFNLDLRAKLLTGSNNQRPWDVVSNVPSQEAGFKDNKQSQIAYIRALNTLKN